MDDEIAGGAQRNVAGRGAGKEADGFVASREISALLSIMAALRDKQTGCPWDLAQSFALDHYNAATPKFDLAELVHLSARLLHATPFATVQERLAAMNLAVDEPLWTVARANIGKLADVGEWLAVCRGTVASVIDDAAFAAKAAALLPPEPWNGGTWSAWTTAVKDATGRKGKELFRPLRLALTGRDHGPEMKDLLPLIGRAKAAARLNGEAA